MGFYTSVFSIRIMPNPLWAIGLFLLVPTEAKLEDNGEDVIATAIF
jgi:hypothetical protein